jgi:hypothetical protein
MLYLNSKGDYMIQDLIDLGFLVFAVVFVVYYLNVICI